MNTATNTSDVVDVTDIAPVGSDRREARHLAETMYASFARLLSSVGADDWRRPTDCDGWTVRDLAGHVVGAMRSAASMREMIRQQRTISRRVKRDGGNAVDVMTAVQIEVTAGLSTDELVAECLALVEPATAGRHRTPALLRRFVRIPVEMGSLSETWRLGYLVDVVLTRNAFLHRVDLARALDVELDVVDEDRRLVADVVAEWARRHGQRFDLRLSGPAGGHFRSASVEAAERIDVDAIEFCRILSGRAAGGGLLGHEVPF